MMQRTLFTIHIALSVLAAGTGIIACGASDADIVAAKPGASDAAATSEASTDAAPAEVDAGTVDAEAGASPSDSGSGDSLCAAEPKRLACVKCCQSNHPAGAQAFDTASRTCACQADVCATDCATTACAATPKKPDAACAACIASSLMKGADGGADDAGDPERGACVTAVKNACSGSSDCVAMEQCENACPKN